MGSSPLNGASFHRWNRRRRTRLFGIITEIKIQASILSDFDDHSLLFSSHNFWKAGSARKGSQSGSSLKSAGVTGAGYKSATIRVCNNL